METTTRRTSTRRPDPAYPFPTEWGTDGRIIYHVPVEADSRDALVTLNIRERESGCNLSFGNGNSIPVVFIKTTDRKFAYDQRAYLNTQHTRDLRRSKREYFFEGTAVYPDGAEIPRDEYEILGKTDEGFDRVEYAELPGLIAEYIGARFPGNPLYRQVYQLACRMTEPKDIAEQLRIRQSMVYYYLKAAYAAAREYRKMYMEN